MAETHRPAHAAETDVPHEEFIQGDRLKIVITGLDENVRAHAVEAADKQLTDKLNDHGGGFKGFVKKMWLASWHGNIMRDYYLNKYTRQAEQNIYESGNIEQNLADSVQDKDLALETTKRWAQAFDENLRQDLLSDDEASTYGLVLERNPDGSENREGARLKAEIQGLVEEFVSGRIPDEDAFNEESKRILNDAAQSGAHSDMIGRGQLYASNLFQIAQNVQAIQMREQSLGRDVSVKDILDNADIIMGSAKIGPETQAQLNRVERTVEKLRGVPILNMVNEATLATAASAIYSIAGWATKTAVGATAAVVAVGATAGVWAGFREARRLKDERSQHSREFARGEFNEADIAGRRRESIEATRYESKSAVELMAQLRLLYNEDGEFRVNDLDSFKEGMQIIAEIEARNRLSSEREIDLVHYSKGEMSREKRLLRLELAKAKVDMRHLLEEADDTMLTAMGINPADIHRLKADPNADVLAFVLDPIRDGNEGVLDINVLGEIDESIKEKDKLYRRLRNKRVAGAVVKGTLLGVAIGTTVQELVIAPLSDNTQGAVERAFGVENADATRQTLLDALANPNQPVDISANYHTIDIPGTENKVTVPDNLTLEKTSENTLSINGNNIQVSDLKLNADGSLTGEARNTLAQAGFAVNEHGSFGPPEIIQHEIKSDPNNIIQNHGDRTVNVTRDHWYDNNTPMRWENGKLVGADHNELGLWNPFRDGDGNIHIRTNMTESGSWTGEERANWEQLAKDGKLQIALSLSKGTQHEVFMIPINAKGEAIIDVNAPENRFFTQGQGRVDFMGKYTEVVEVRGVDSAGKTHIAPLATDIGKGLKTIPDIVTETRPNPIIEYSLDYQPNKDPFVAVPPVLPWYPRNGLEPIRPQIEPTPYYLGGYFDSDPATREKYLSRMSPRLRSGRNPDIDLDEREETQWYWNSQTAAHRTRITTLANTIAPMASSTEIVVAMPVAGHQEQDNIYRSLMAYLNQSLDPSRFELVLYVNHPETDAKGNPTSAQATLDEIARFQADHPELPVRVMYEQLPRSEAKIGTIRKILNDAIIKRSLDRTATPGRDIILVSNDADVISMSDTYLENFVDKFNKDPDIDAMLGQLDWDNEAYLRYPQIHVATRLFLYDEIMKRRAGNWIGSSGGNFSLLLKNFAAVGGYSTGLDIAEDVELGRALKAARSGAKKKKAIGFAGNKASRLETSARRAVYVYETYNDAPYHQWNYSFSADDDAVRKLSMDKEPPDLTDPAERDQLVQSTQRLVNRTLSSMIRGNPSSATADGTPGAELRGFVERSLTFCGLKFRWEDDGKSIEIIDADNMIAGIEAFAKKNSGRLVPA